MPASVSMRGVGLVEGLELPRSRRTDFQSVQVDPGRIENPSYERVAVSDLTHEGTRSGFLFHRVER
jgi:hypothetical protein